MANVKNEQSVQMRNDNGFVGLDNQDGDYSVGNTNDVNEQNSNNNPSTQEPPTDPGNIHVNINDTTAPIVLLFGAKSTGKTMTLVRLAKYLESKSTSTCTVDVDHNFCDIWEYKKNAKNFGVMKRTVKKLEPTDRNDFLFVKVLNTNKKTICQILEAAGEDYFPPSNLVADRTSEDFPGYMNDVFNTPNKKVWVFLLDSTWTNQIDKNDFVARIKYCKDNFFDWSKDKCIILYNKIDLTNFGAKKRKDVRKSAAELDCKNCYHGIFDVFSGNNLFESNRFEFEPFSTGKFPADGNYNTSDYSYPESLWNLIKKLAGIRE